MSLPDAVFRIVLCMVVGLILGGLAYLDYLAFCEKFPNAAWWAWLFSHR